MRRLPRLPSFIITLLVSLLLTACASTPPPEEICSAAWIKPRTDAALDEFKDATSGKWKTLQRSSEQTANGNDLGLLEKARVILSLASVVSSFQNSQALEDLQTLGKTCDDPELVSNALRGVLSEYGVPDTYIDLLDELEGFIELMNNSSQTR